MLGYIEYDENNKIVHLAQRRMLGGTFLALTFGRENRGVAARFHAVRAAKRMHDQGVRRAVFPVDFPYTSLFIRQGVLPMETLPLRRVICAAFVKRRMEELGIAPTQGVIALSGEYLSREMRAVTKSLALSFRYVLLAAGEGGEELARELRREYGISLLLKPTRDQLERADALVLFSPRGDLTGENKVLCALYPGGEYTRGRLPLSLGKEMVRTLPPNCDLEQLAAALHAMGVLDTEMISGEIEVDRNEKCLYNAKHC